MEVQAFKLHVVQLFGVAYCRLHVGHGYAKLVFGQASSDVCMRVCPDVRVYPERNPCGLAGLLRQFVYDIKFGNALNVEAENVFFQAKVYLPVAFAHTRENNLFG